MRTPDNLVALGPVFERTAEVRGGLPPCVCDGSGWFRDRDLAAREIFRPCPGCASSRIVRQFGEMVCTWANWIPRQELEAQVDRLRAWRGGREWACLLHAGDGQRNRGAGKSHAMQATAHSWAARGILGRYVAVPDFLERHRQAIGDDSVRLPSVAEFEGLAVLDDLGEGPVTPWVQDVIERIAGYRYPRQLPTLIATNLDLGRLEDKFPRLVDRCFEGVLIEWQASSWRRR